jgi:hypothetical protein
MAPPRTLAKKVLAVGLCLSLLPVPPLPAWADDVPAPAVVADKPDAGKTPPDSKKSAEDLAAIAAALGRLEPFLQRKPGDIKDDEWKKFDDELKTIQRLWGEVEKDKELAKKLEELKPKREKAEAFAKLRGGAPQPGVGPQPVDEAQSRVPAAATMAALPSGTFAPQAPDAVRAAASALLFDNNSRIQDMSGTMTGPLGAPAGTIVPPDSIFSAPKDYHQLGAGPSSPVPAPSSPVPVPSFASGQSILGPELKTAVTAAGAAAVKAANPTDAAINAYRALSDRAAKLLSSAPQRNAATAKPQDLEAFRKERQTLIAAYKTELDKKQGAQDDKGMAAERARAQTLLTMLIAMDPPTAEPKPGQTPAQERKQAEKSAKLSRALAAAKVLEGDQAGLDGRLAAFFDNAANRALVEGTPLGEAAKQWGTLALNDSRAKDEVTVPGWLLGNDKIVSATRRRGYETGDGALAALARPKTSIPNTDEKIAPPVGIKRDGIVTLTRDGARQFISADGNYTETIINATTKDGQAIYYNSSGHPVALPANQTPASGLRRLQLASLRDGPKGPETALTFYRAEKGDSVIAGAVDDKGVRTLAKATSAQTVLLNWSRIQDDKHFVKVDYDRGSLARRDGDKGWTYALDPGWTGQNDKRKMSYSTYDKDGEHVQYSRWLERESTKPDAAWIEMQQRQIDGPKGTGASYTVTRKIASVNVDVDITSVGDSITTTPRAGVPEALEKSLSQRAAQERAGTGTAQRLEAGDVASVDVNLDLGPGGQRPSAAQLAEILRGARTQLHETDEFQPAAANLMSHVFDNLALQTGAVRTTGITVSFTPGQEHTETIPHYESNGSPDFPVVTLVSEDKIKHRSASTTVTLYDQDAQGPTAPRVKHFDQVDLLTVPKTDELPEMPHCRDTVQCQDKLLQYENTVRLAGIRDALAARDKTGPFAWVPVDEYRRHGTDGVDKVVHVATGYLGGTPDRPVEVPLSIGTTHLEAGEVQSRKAALDDAAANQEMLAKASREGGFMNYLLLMAAPEISQADSARIVAPHYAYNGAAHLRTITVAPETPGGAEFKRDYRVGSTMTVFNASAHAGDWTTNSIQLNDWGEANPKTSAVLGGVAGGVIEGVGDPKMLAFMAGTAGLGTGAAMAMRFGMTAERVTTGLGATARLTARSLSATKQIIDTGFQAQMTIGMVTSSYQIAAGFANDDAEMISGGTKGLTSNIAGIVIFAPFAKAFHVDPSIMEAPRTPAVPKPKAEPEIALAAAPEAKPIIPSIPIARPVIAADAPLAARPVAAAAPAAEAAVLPPSPGLISRVSSALRALKTRGVGETEARTETPVLDDAAAPQAKPLTPSIVPPEIAADAPPAVRPDAPAVEPAAVAPVAPSGLFARASAAVRALKTKVTGETDASIADAASRKTDALIKKAAAEIGAADRSAPGDLIARLDRELAEPRKLRKAGKLSEEQTAALRDVEAQLAGLKAKAHRTPAGAAVADAEAAAPAGEVTAPQPNARGQETTVAPGSGEAAMTSGSAAAPAPGRAENSGANPAPPSGSSPSGSSASRGNDAGSTAGAGARAPPAPSRVAENAVAAAGDAHLPADVPHSAPAAQARISATIEPARPANAAPAATVEAAQLAKTAASAEMLAPAHAAVRPELEPAQKNPSELVARGPLVAQGGSPTMRGMAAGGDEAGSFAVLPMPRVPAREGSAAETPSRPSSRASARTSEEAAPTNPADSEAAAAIANARNDELMASPGRLGGRAVAEPAAKGLAEMQAFEEAGLSPTAAAVAERPTEHGAFRPASAPEQPKKTSWFQNARGWYTDKVQRADAALARGGDELIALGNWINTPARLPILGKLWQWGPGLIGQYFIGTGQAMGGRLPFGATAGALEAKAKTLETMKDFPGGAGGVLSSGKTLRALLTRDIEASDLPYKAEIRSQPDVSPKLPTTLDEVVRAPVAHVTDIGLASEEHSGSAGLVRLAYLADGRPVAVKTYYLAEMKGESRADELPGVMLKEARAAELYSKLGIGPEFHGLWKDADGRWNIVFDIARGDFSGTPVKDVTFRDLETILARMKAAGVKRAGDLQIYRSPEGRLQVIDPNSAAEGLHEPHYSDDDPSYGYAASARAELLRQADAEVGRRYLARLRAEDPDAFAPLAQRLTEREKTAGWAHETFGDLLVEPSTGKFVTSGEIHSEEMIAKLDEAGKAMRDLNALRAKKGLRELTIDEQNDVFQTRLYRILNPLPLDALSGRPVQGPAGRKNGRGGLSVFDSPMADKRIPTKDHHGAYFDANNPEVNTTMLLLRDIERTLSKNGASPKALDALARRFERVHTDNLGDGMWAAWIARNIRRVAQEPALREKISRATHYEDFGLFGRQAVEQAKSDPKLAEAIELQNSILHGYDAIVRDNKLSSDRFDSLPAERQREVFERALAHIDRVLAEPDYRAAQASEFEKNVEAARIAAEKAAIKPPAELLRDPDAARVLRDVRLVDYDKLDGHGLFAGWAGQARSHDKALLLSFKTLAPDAEGRPRTQMILSVPHGKTYRALEPIGAWLRAANEARAKKLDVDPKTAGAVFGRAALQVAFAPGLLLTRGEIVAELGRYGREAAKAEKLMVVKANAALDAPEFKPQDLVAALKTDFTLAGEYSQGVGVREGYILDEHTLSVMRQFERYLAKDQSPERRRLFRAMLAFHDIGKPESVRAGDKNRQHEFTTPMLRYYLDKLGFSKKDVALAEAIVDADPIGPLIRIKPAYETGSGAAAIPKEAFDHAVAEIETGAKRAGVTPREYLDQVMKFYLADAGSYTVDAGMKKALDGLFDFDRAEGAATGAMRLKPEHEAKLKPLFDHFTVPELASPQAVPATRTFAQKTSDALRGAVDALRALTGRPARPQLPQPVVSGAADFIAASIKRSSKTPNAHPDEAALRAFVTDEFAPDLASAIQERAAYYSQRAGKPVEASLAFEDGKIVARFAGFADIRVALNGSDGEIKLTPNGDSYTKFTPRPFIDLTEVRRELPFQVDEVRGATQNYKNLDLAFGFAEKPAKGGQTLTYPDLPGVRQVIHRPQDTVTFYRGFKADDLAAVEAFARQGLLARFATPEKLKAAIDEFVRRDEDGRRSFMSRQDIVRRTASGDGGTTEILVGGSRNLTAASQWGGFVFEAAVPREAFYHVSRDGLYHGENESYVPFGVHPSWVKRILDNKGNVLVDFTGKNGPVRMPAPKPVEVAAPAAAPAVAAVKPKTKAELLRDHPQYADAINHPEAAVAQLLEKGDYKGLSELVGAVNSTAIDRAVVVALADKTNPDSAALLGAIIRKASAVNLKAAEVLARPEWAGHPELVEALIQNKPADLTAGLYAFSAGKAFDGAHWNPKWVDFWKQALAEKSEDRAAFIEKNRPYKLAPKAVEPATASSEPRGWLAGLRRVLGLSARPEAPAKAASSADVPAELAKLTAEIKSQLQRNPKVDYEDYIVTEADIQRWIEGYKKVTGVEIVRARDVVELMRDHGSEVLGLYEKMIRLNLITFSAKKFDEAGMTTFMENMFRGMREGGVAGTDVALNGGLTDLGGIKIGYKTGAAAGVELVGITAGKAAMYDVAKVDKAIALGNKFGEESPLFLSIGNVTLVVGGGAQGRTEARHSLDTMPERTLVIRGFLEQKADGSRVKGAADLLYDELGQSGKGRWVEGAEDPARSGYEAGRYIVDVMRASRDQKFDNPFVRLAMENSPGSIAEAGKWAEGVAERYRVLRVLNALQKKMAGEDLPPATISEGLLEVGKRMSEATAGIDNIKDNGAWRKGMTDALAGREGDGPGMQAVSAAAAKIDMDVMFASWFGTKQATELSGADDRGLRRYFDRTVSGIPADMILKETDAPHTFNKKDYAEIRLDMATTGLLKAKDARPEIFLGTQKEMANYYRAKGFTKQTLVADSNGTNYMLLEKNSDYGRWNPAVDALARIFPSLSRKSQVPVLQGVDSESRLAQVSALMQTQGVKLENLVIRGELERVRAKNREVLEAALLEKLDDKPIAAVVVGDKNHSVEAIAEAAGVTPSEVKRLDMVTAGPFRFERVEVTDAAGKPYMLLAFAPAYGELTADLVTAAYGVGARNFMLGGAGGSLIPGDRVGTIQNVVSSDYKGRRIDLDSIKGLTVLKIRDAPDGHNNTSPTPLEQTEPWADAKRAQGTKNVDQETFHVFDALEKGLEQDRRLGLDPRAAVQVGLHMSDVVGSNGLAAGTVDLAYAPNIRSMARAFVERLGLGTVVGRSGPHRIADARAGLLAEEGTQLGEMGRFAPSKDLSTVWDNGWGDSIKQFKGQRRVFEVETSAIGPADRAYLDSVFAGLSPERVWVTVRQSDPNYVDVLRLARQHGLETILLVDPAKAGEVRGDTTFTLRDAADKEGRRTWDEFVRDGKNDEYETNRAQHYRLHVGDVQAKPDVERPGFLYQNELTPQELTAKFDAESRRAHQKIEDEISARFKTEGKRVPNFVDVDKLDSFIGDRIPVLISGSSKKSWPNVTPENQRLVERTLSEMLDRLDKNKHLLLTGGTEFGAEAILHRLAAEKGFKVLGTLTENADPAEVSQHIGDLTMLGINWFGKSRPVLNLVKKHDGFVLFQGGGKILAEEIELAARMNVRMYLQRGPEGAANDAAAKYQQHAFDRFADLEPRLRESGVLKDTIGERLSSLAQSGADQLGRLIGRDPEVMRVSRLGDAQRRFELLKKGLPPEQVDAVMKAHEEAPCRVYRCSGDQIEAKLRIMKDGGVPLDLRKRLIREGYAGSEKTLGLSSGERAAKRVVDRVPRTMEDFVQIFGTQKAIDSNMNADIVLALAKEWDVKDLEVVKRRIRNATDVYAALVEVRDSNRALREAFETLNPGKAPGALLSDLARETHAAWLQTVKASPDYVEYGQGLHDLLLDQVRAGVVKVKDAAGQRSALTAADFESPKKKFKFKAGDFQFESETQRAAFEKRFKEITGKDLKDAQINTVAGEWDGLAALKPRTQGADWSAKRQAYLYGLQADSVGAIVAAFSGERGEFLLERLGSGSEHDKLRALTDVLRTINVGWRVNNPWGGFSDKLIHKPFDLEENGGIGIDEIHRDAVVLKAILGSMRRHMETGTLRMTGDAQVELEHAFERGLGEALDKIVDKDVLAGVVRETRPPEFTSVPKNIDDFGRLFGNGASIDAALNADVVTALSKEWDVADLTEVTRRIRNAGEVFESLKQVRDGNRTLMGDFEKANPGKDPGTVLSDLARHTHDAWLAGVKAAPDYVEYDQKLHDLLLHYAEQGVVKRTDAAGKRVNLTPADLENPKAKYKIKPGDFEFKDDAQRAEFETRFRTIAGRELKGSLINTVAGEWEGLSKLQARVNIDEWAAKRPGYLYGLQADSVGAIMGALSGRAGRGALEKLASGTEAERMEALVDLLRKINVGWRVNNPWGGFTDRLINKPFDLEENGGIGIEDIRKDAVVLKAVMGVLRARLESGSVRLPDEVSAPLKRAFETGLERPLDRLLDRDALADAVRRYNRHEAFTEASNAELRKIVDSDPLQVVDLDAAVRASGLNEAQLKAFKDAGARVMTVHEFLRGADARVHEAGYSLGSDDPNGFYRALVDRAHLQPWETTYRQLYDDRSRPRTTDFLDRITAEKSDKPVVFFVPPHKPGVKRVTSEELDWLLAHPDRLKKVSFVFGVSELVSAAKLEETGLAKMDAQKRADYLSQVLRLARDPEVLRNGALDDGARRGALEKQGLNPKQIDAVMKAHADEALRCDVYNCTPRQIEAKLKLMKDAGIDLDARKRLIREGYAGSAPQAPAEPAAPAGLLERMLSVFSRPRGKSDASVAAAVAEPAVVERGPRPADVTPEKRRVGALAERLHDEERSRFKIQGSDRYQPMKIKIEGDEASYDLHNLSYGELPPIIREIHDRRAGEALAIIDRQLARGGAIDAEFVRRAAAELYEHSYDYKSQAQPVALERLRRDWAQKFYDAAGAAVEVATGKRIETPIAPEPASVAAETPAAAAPPRGPPPEVAASQRHLAEALGELSDEKACPLGDCHNNVKRLLERVQRDHPDFPVDEAKVLLIDRAGERFRSESDLALLDVKDAGAKAYGFHFLLEYGGKIYDPAFAGEAGLAAAEYFGRMFIKDPAREIKVIQEGASAGLVDRLERNLERWAGRQTFDTLRVREIPASDYLGGLHEKIARSRLSAVENLPARTAAEYLGLARGAAAPRTGRKGEAFEAGAAKVEYDPDLIEAGSVGQTSNAVTVLRPGDRDAVTYNRTDRGLEELQKGFYSERMLDVAGLKRVADAGGVILDMAGSDGLFVQELREKHGIAAYTLDLVPGGVARDHMLMDLRGVEGRDVRLKPSLDDKHFLWGDAVRTPLADGSVRVIYDTYGVMEYNLGRDENRLVKKALNEWQRILEPGGVIRFAPVDYTQKAAMKELAESVGLVMTAFEAPYPGADHRAVEFSKAGAASRALQGSGPAKPSTPRDLAGMSPEKFWRRYDPEKEELSYASLDPAVWEKAPKFLDLGRLVKARLDRAVELALVRAEPEVLVDAVGVSPEKAAQIEKLGAQGDEKTCGIHGLAACSAALGRAVDMAAVKAEAAKVRPDFASRGVTESQIAEIARRLGFDAKFLDSGRQTELLARKVLDKGLRDPAARRFLSKAAGLRQRALAELAAGKPVLLSLELREQGHAVTLLSVGKNAEGRRIARYYEPEAGRVVSMPFDELLPSQATVLEAPTARARITARGGDLTLDGKPYHDDPLSLHRPVADSLLGQLQAREPAAVMQRVREVFDARNDGRSPVWHGQRLPIVLRELVVNAQRAAQSRKGAGRVSVEAAVFDGRLRIAVADDGLDMRGVDFEPFFKQGATSKKGMRNVGNGLYYSRRFVEELLGGTVTGAPNGSRGARFTVEVPLEPEARLAPSPRPGGTASARPGGTLAGFHPARSSFRSVSALDDFAPVVAQKLGLTADKFSIVNYEGDVALVMLHKGNRMERVPLTDVPDSRAFSRGPVATRTSHRRLTIDEDEGAKAAGLDSVQFRKFIHGLKKDQKIGAADNLRFDLDTHEILAPYEDVVLETMPKPRRSH